MLQFAANCDPAVFRRLFTSPAELRALRCTCAQFCREIGTDYDPFTYRPLGFRQNSLITSPEHRYKYDVDIGYTVIWYDSECIVLTYRSPYDSTDGIAYSPVTGRYAYGDTSKIAWLWQIFRLDPAEMPR